MNRRLISSDTLDKLGKLIKLIGDSEVKIELHRQQLAKSEKFEPYATF